MVLQDRKIPILTGINDVPSTVGGANHPNASLLCKQYNDLIDDLNKKDFSASNIVAYPPNIEVRTKEELFNALDTIPSKVLYQEIRLMQNIVDEFTVLDFSKFLPIFSRAYGLSENVLPQFDKGIQVTNDSSLLRYEIKINSTYDSVNFETVNTPYSNIIAPQGIGFWKVKLKLVGNEAINIRDSIVAFDTCEFDASTVTNYLTTIIQAVNSKIYFKNCIFNWNTAVGIDSLINAHYSDISFENLTIIPPAGTFGKNFWGERSSYYFNNVTPVDFQCSARHGWVHIKKSSGALLSAYDIDASNFIKEVI